VCGAIDAYLGKHAAQLPGGYLASAYPRLKVEYFCNVRIIESGPWGCVLGKGLFGGRQRLGKFADLFRQAIARRYRKRIQDPVTRQDDRRVRVLTPRRVALISDIRFRPVIARRNELLPGYSCRPITNLLPMD